jgi:hypothetical protein
MWALRKLRFAVTVRRLLLSATSAFDFLAAAERLDGGFSDEIRRI